MSKQIPVWRVTHGHGPGDWTLVADGHIMPSVEHASPQVPVRMWSASIESIIREEFTSIGLPLCSPHDDERRNCMLSAKENFQPKPMVLGSLAEKNSGRVLKGVSPKKRGILTANSALCNGSAAASKRQRQYEASCTQQSDVQPMFQTASRKPVQISSLAMQKAKSLLGFDDIGPCTTNGKEQCPPSNSRFTVASTNRDLSGGNKRQLDDDAMLGSFQKQSANASACLFQTAAGKAVSISNAGMHRAVELFGNTENFNLGNSVVDHASLRSGLNQNSSLNTFQISEGQPISMSRPAGKQVAMLLGEENSFELPSSSSSARFVTGQHSIASACLFQTATGKAVPISNAGMHRAVALLGDKEASNIDINPGINMFQTAQGQSVSVSSTAMKKATKLLEEENFSFPIEAPSSSPSIRFVTGMGQSVSVSSSAMKRAKDLLGGELESSDIITPAHLINGEEHNSQRLFETSEGHLIKVSSGSIQLARALLKDRALNTSLGASTSPSHNLNMDGFKIADAQECPPRKGFKSLHNHSVQEPKFCSINRKGIIPRKFVASFKAPRRLQPAMSPATNSCPKQGLIQSVKHDFSQLVNMNPLPQKKKQKSSFKEFFRQQPHQEKELGHLTKRIETITSEAAKSYKFSSTIQGLESIGSDEFRAMLLEVGANAQTATKEWVDNHYRWIVWKLASLERSYPLKVANKLLTIQRVFDELRYRYEREVDCAHRSAIKKVTEGDAAAGRMMVLCVAAVSIRDHTPQPNLVERCLSQHSGDSLPVQIEVTDGWYSLIAHLDAPLISQLLAGKVFIGQKLRVCRATLLGCTTPMPPLEAYQAMKLALHINGTYRAHWMDKLGFCKGMPMPLAFHCIKSDGGIVPRTIIGIHRIYPVLYYERLPNRGSITRSARAEDLAVRGFHDRRNQIAEEAVIRMERECVPQLPENDMEEGAKIFQLLENSTEPELLMADMSAAQHAVFAAYQAKREAARQSLVQKKILEALGDVHLDAREVTPFMKLSVMGLSFVGCKPDREYQACCRGTKGGIVTVWQVTEDQVDALKEGAVVCVSDLYPLSGRSNQQIGSSVLHLRATKATKWQLMPQATFSCFTPRQALRLSLLGTLPFSSEFDVAVLIVHVGKPYACGLHQRQWLFASDGSVEEEFSKESQKLISLLAIDLSTSREAFLPVERSLEGCIMGYCNLIKRSRDQRNCIWVAEASENAIFSSNLSSCKFSHLKAAANSVNKWAKSSEKSVAELEERINMVLAGGS